VKPQVSRTPPKPVTDATNVLLQQQISAKMEGDALYTRNDWNCLCSMINCRYVWASLLYPGCPSATAPAASNGLGGTLVGGEPEWWF